MMVLNQKNKEGNVYFTLNQEAFAGALKTVIAIIPDRTPFDILRSVTIEVKEKRLVLTGSDGNTLVRKEVDVDGKTEEGRAVVNVHQLMELVRANRGTEISLRSNGDGIKFESGRFKANLVQMVPEQCPELLKLPGETVFEFPLELLFEMFGICSFAVSREDTRPVITGINWEIGETDTRMVATDGFRLVCVSRQMKTATKTRLLLSPEALEVLPDEGGMVKVFCDPKTAGFVLKDTTVITKMIDGTYPDWERVIPRNCENCATINLKTFLSALRRAAVVANPINKQISLEFKRNGMVLRAKELETGESEEELDCQYHGKELRIEFNGRYLLDILHHINTEEIILELTSPETPMLLRPISVGEEARDLFVLMPVVNEG